MKNLKIFLYHTDKDEGKYIDISNNCHFRFC